jgi:RNA polymerase sigma-70 factor (ECF subfamily)
MSAEDSKGTVSEFESFYRQHLRLVHAVALARTADRDGAEDMTQETFLRAWRSFPHLSGLEPRAQRAWLCRTARNLAIDAWRRKRLDSAPPAPGSGGEPSDLRLDVARALAELNEGDRELVVMRYLEEMNSREIGEALGLPEGTVRRRLVRCRELLAGHLSQWAPDGGVQ